MVGGPTLTVELADSDGLDLLAQPFAPENADWRAGNG